MIINDAGKPIRFCLTGGNRSDYKGADILLERIDNADTLIADKGYDSKKIRKKLKAKKIKPCIPYRKNVKVKEEYDKKKYKKRHKIENFFSFLKDFRKACLRTERNGEIFKNVINFIIIFKSYYKP